MKKLRDLIGQQFVVGELRTLVNGVTALGIVCPPVLLTGAKGLGKTLLARTVAAELGSSYQEFNGRGDFNSLIGGLISADRGDVICIDEVHGLSAAQQELLYPAIDGGQLRRPKGFRIKGNEDISIEPFTLIATTNQPGKLLQPFRDRLTEMELSHFPIDKMRELVQAFAAEEQLLLKRNSITPLARAASCSAREARKLVQHFKIWLAGNGIDFTSPAGVDEVRLYLAGKRIDTFCDAQNQRYSWGVGPKEERFLRAAASTSKYSRCRMALHLGYDRDEGSLAELEVKMERVGFIDLGGGLKNIITAAGREWLAKRNGEAPRGEAG